MAVCSVCCGAEVGQFLTEPHIADEDLGGVFVELFDGAGCAECGDDTRTDRGDCGMRIAECGIVGSGCSVRS